MGNYVFNFWWGDHHGIDDIAFQHTSTVSGTCRKRKKERIDKDVKRPKKNEDPLSSEAAFKRARRESVANAVRNGWDQSLAFNLDEDPTHELWAEAHEKEFEFQKKKQTEHMVSAYQERGTQGIRSGSASGRRNTCEGTGERQIAGPGGQNAKIFR